MGEILTILLMAAESLFGHVLFFNPQTDTCSSNAFLINSLKQGNLVLYRQAFPIRDNSAHGP